MVIASSSIYNRVFDPKDIYYAYSNSKPICNLSGMQYLATDPLAAEK